MAELYDIIVVGGGPAGLTAALYARRANKRVLIIEKETFGGQITFSPKVENYPGLGTVSGNELADRFVSQVLEQGADVELANVTGIRNEKEDIKTVVTDTGEFEAKAVILAVGVRHRMLGVARETEFVGNGISFCAVCDGAFYRDKDVIVIGGGNSALQEAILLSENCRRVTVVQNLAVLTGEEQLQLQLKKRGNVDFRYSAKVKELHGDTDLTAVTVYYDDGKEDETIACDGMFIAIGLEPKNAPFANAAALDGAGYFAADENCTSDVPGIFTAGDCRAKKIRQVATAVGDGAVAAQAACAYLDGRK